MNYLLDTHALIWFVEGDTKLPQRIRALIADPANAIWVSHASIWEIAIKISLSNYNFPSRWQSWNRFS